VNSRLPKLVGKSLTKSLPLVLPLAGHIKNMARNTPDGEKYCRGKCLYLRG